MATVVPFRGIGYNRKLAGRAENVAAPPSESLTEAEIKEYIEKNEYNIINITMHFDKRFAGSDVNSAKNVMKAWLEKGVFTQRDRAAFYIYEQLFSEGLSMRCVRSVIGRVKVEDYGEDAIFPHEWTTTSASEELLDFWNGTGVNPCPVWSFYSDEGGRCESIVALECEQSSPVCEFTDESGVMHKLWAAESDGFSQSFAAALKDKPLFIAEGHHRYETALKYRDLCHAGGSSRGDYIMMALTPMEHTSLGVLPIHRLINYADFDENIFIGNLTEKFSVSKIYLTDDDYSKTMLEKLEKEQGENVFALYAGADYYYFLKRRKELPRSGEIGGRSESYRALDIAVLNEFIIKDCLCGGDEAAAQVTYTRFAQKAVETVKAKKCSFAVLLNPTLLSELRAVSLSGDRLPKFSAYFRPKIITGLVLDKM